MGVTPATVPRWIIYPHLPIGYQLLYCSGLNRLIVQVWWQVRSPSTSTLPICCTTLLKEMPFAFIWFNHIAPPLTYDVLLGMSLWIHTGQSYRKYRAEMDKASMNWMVGQEKMLCAYHSFMSPKGALKELLLRQIDLPFAKLCFIKCQGVWKIQCSKKAKQIYAVLILFTSGSLASCSSLHIFELRKIHLYISNKTINSIFAEGLEYEILYVWCHEGFKEEQGVLPGSATYIEWERRAIKQYKQASLETIISGYFTGRAGYRNIFEK